MGWETDDNTEVKAKKILSAEEHAMRRAEMARRRKNLSEKRKEEEKVCDIHSALISSYPIRPSIHLHILLYTHEH